MTPRRAKTRVTIVLESRNTNLYLALDVSHSGENVVANVSRNLTARVCASNVIKMSTSRGRSQQRAVNVHTLLHIYMYIYIYINTVCTGFYSLFP